jgi:hypothetical protein
VLMRVLEHVRRQGRFGCCIWMLHAVIRSLPQAPWQVRVGHSARLCGGYGLEA